MRASRIRLAGQDSERGTFSQRHAVLHDCQDGHTYTPLQHLAANQAPVEIYNSPLSETGVLGFEYGYSLDCPDSLVLWEAQFGDFWNVAQPIVDQFITSAEDKWQRLSGLVLLLPHGFEGQGPEHSSARVERFLLNVADDNIQVVYPSRPAQYFHCLRRQMLRAWRKPLVVITPKSLLRCPRRCPRWRTAPRERSRGSSPTRWPSPRAEAKRIVLCTGKIYYELEAYRQEARREDVAIIRLEQLYPLPQELLEWGAGALRRRACRYFGCRKSLRTWVRGCTYGFIWVSRCSGDGPSPASPAMRRRPPPPVRTAGTSKNRRRLLLAPLARNRFPQPT